MTQLLLQVPQWKTDLDSLQMLSQRVPSVAEKLEENLLISSSQSSATRLGFEQLESGHSSVPPVPSTVVTVKTPKWCDVHALRFKEV